MTTSDERRAAGREIQGQLWPATLKGPTGQFPAAKLAPDYYDHVQQSAFGDIWTRPGLSVRDRSMITVAVLASLGQPEELRAHLAGALNVGIDPRGDRGDPHAHLDLRRRAGGRLRHARRGRRPRHGLTRGRFSPPGSHRPTVRHSIHTRQSSTRHLLLARIVYQSSSSSGPVDAVAEDAFPSEAAILPARRSFCRISRSLIFRCNSSS